MTGEWENKEKRLSPPKGPGIFETTLIDTLLFQQVSMDGVEKFTAQVEGGGRGKGGKGGKGKGKDKHRGKDQGKGKWWH